MFAAGAYCQECGAKGIQVASNYAKGLSAPAVGCGRCGWFNSVTPELAAELLGHESTWLPVKQTDIETALSDPISYAAYMLRQTENEQKLMEDETPSQRAYREACAMSKSEALKRVREMRRKLAKALRKQKMNKRVK